MGAGSSPPPSGPSEPEHRTATSASVLLHDRRAQPVDWPDLPSLERLARDVMSALALQRAVVEITLVDRDEMRRLNALHMGGDTATDVLAFPIDGPESISVAAGEPRRVGLVEVDGDLRPTHGWTVAPGPPALLGDVVVCPDVAADQARAAGHDDDDEVAMLLVHGLLHVLGHDHAADDDRRVMFALTDVLLERCRAQAVP